MKPRLEFTIERVTSEAGRTLVDGRVCDSAISVGDVFTRVYGHRQRWDGKEWVPTDPRPTEVVRLVVQSIESYRRSWEQIDHGMTARLALAGDGLDRLFEGRILGYDDTGQPEH